MFSIIWETSEVTMLQWDGNEYIAVVVRLVIRIINILKGIVITLYACTLL